MFLDFNKPLKTCSHSSCEDCPLLDLLYCHFKGVNLAKFLAVGRLFMNPHRNRCVCGKRANIACNQESPFRVWREYCQLTHRKLSEMAEISMPYISQFESGKRTCTRDVLNTIANALHLNLDDIVKIE